MYEFHIQLLLCMQYFNYLNINFKKAHCLLIQNLSSRLDGVTGFYIYDDRNTFLHQWLDRFMFLNYIKTIQYLRGWGVSTLSPPPPGLGPDSDPYCTASTVTLTDWLSAENIARLRARCPSYCTPPLCHHSAARRQYSSSAYEWSPFDLSKS